MRLILNSSAPKRLPSRDRKGAEPPLRTVNPPMTNAPAPGDSGELKQSFEKAVRVADFFELGELMCRDAKHPNESCGGHSHEEQYAAAWEWAARDQPPILSQRSYK